MAGQRVPFEGYVVRVQAEDADVAVVEDLVVRDPTVRRVEEPQALTVRFEPVCGHSVVLEAETGRLEDDHTGELALGQRHVEELVLGGVSEDGGERKLAHRATPNSHPSVALVQNPEVAGLALAVLKLAVAVDRVSVQIERDVVGSDHDAVARAVHEVAVECRVRGDGVAAAHVARGRLTCGEREADSGECEDHREFTDSHRYRHRLTSCSGPGSSGPIRARPAASARGYPR